MVFSVPSLPYGHAAGTSLTSLPSEDPHAGRNRTRISWSAVQPATSMPPRRARVKSDTYTVDGFIFVGTNFRGLNENDTFVGFKIRDHSIFLHFSYRKSLIRWYWNSWIAPSTKTTKIGTPRKLRHPQYIIVWLQEMKLQVFYLS